MSDEDLSPPPRRKGRPPGKRGTFSFRVTADLRSRLETAAAESERPVSEEIERRLDLSFYNKDMIDQAIKTAYVNAVDSSFELLISRSGGEEGWNAGNAFGQLFKNMNTDLDMVLGAKQFWWEDEQRVELLKKRLAAAIPHLVDRLATDSRKKEAARRWAADTPVAPGLIIELEGE